MKISNFPSSIAILVAMASGGAAEPVLPLPPAPGTTPAELAPAELAPAETILEGGVFKPKEYDLTRYDNMRQKSPFEFEVAAPPVMETVDPFEGIKLGGFAGGGSSLTVYLLDTKKNNERISVYADASPRKRKDASGYRILKVNRAKSLSRTTIDLEKDGRTGTVSFDPELLKQMKGGAAAGGGAAGLPGAPGGLPQPGANRGGLPRPIIPGLPNPGGAQQGAFQPASPLIIGNPTQQPAQPVPMPNGGLPNQLNLLQNQGIPAAQLNVNQVPNQPGAIQQQPVPGQNLPGAAPAQPVLPVRRRVVLPSNP